MRGTIPRWKLDWMTSKIILTLKDILVLKGKMSLLLCLESEFVFRLSVIHPSIYLQNLSSFCYFSVNQTHSSCHRILDDSLNHI